MYRVSSLLREDREFRDSLKTMAEAYSAAVSLPMVVNGLTGGARDAYLCEAVSEAVRISSSAVPVFVGNDEEAERICALLCGSGLRASVYRPRDLVFHNIFASHDIERERLSVLYKLVCGRLDVVVTTPAAALGITIPKGTLSDICVHLTPGEQISPQRLAQRLVSLGFSPVDTVEGAGQYARRGGIVDFWGADMEMPVRVEFFGDEVDRMVNFDPLTQCSVDNREEVYLLPACEVIVDAAARAAVSKEIEKLLRNSSISDEIRERLTRERGAVDSNLPIDFKDKYLGVIYEGGECLLDYMSDGKCIVFNVGTNECRDNASGHLKKLENTIQGMLSVGSVSKKAARYSYGTDRYERFFSENMTLYVNPFAGGVGGMKLSGLFGFRCRSTVSYGGNPAMLHEDLRGYINGRYRTVILTENNQGAQSLADALRDADIFAAVIDEGFDISKAEGGSVLISVGAWDGFDLVTPKIAVLSMAQDRGKAVMAHKRRQRVQRRLGGGGKRLMSYAELEVGDYVVHANYGIGLFEGVESVTVDGVTKDYITIKYAGTDKLFVPCDRLEMIGKYIGDREKDGTVKLSQMGGTGWMRAKTKAKAAARDIAKKLTMLYAERQRLPGFAFPKQSELEDEFESEFGYEETESQLTAIEEIKADMIKPVPMNRLLCGDVGFGKTEVALRAAFKAVLGGKQVAFLVPTTILALQHYQTALSRMRGYAVNIEMISRFKKPKERADILRRVAKGQVDILIGTHSLIAKEVRFYDLGLLIIDEEQRFGVAQKERLREMVKNVDTLMLSATPIPRTLNMAMSGISDISVLDEAPGDRRPVATYVLEHDNGLIADAIRRELDRQGQVLYLYNKINDIGLVAGRIAEAVPEARVAYAHGRMEREELEDIWQWLVRGEIDVLVCTTIIETGVDLPNANTLVIENADRFGLSQLHQIRGRVGRSERQAYAYLTYRPTKTLSEIAEKRLSTIREFAEFGAGFKIALRDMEIRGAGNLLGAEQHGYIESVGYDLYVKLLNEAVLEERGEAAPESERFESTVVMSVSAHIPEYYVKSSAVRMEMYKKISHIECREDRDNIIDEFMDRFGEMPKATERLLNIALAKALAERNRIKKLEYAGGRLTFISEQLQLSLWSEVFAKFASLSFVGVGSPAIAYRLKRNEDPAAVAAEVLLAYDAAASEIESN